jgi:hypothetical protein
MCRDLCGEVQQEDVHLGRVPAGAAEGLLGALSPAGAAQPAHRPVYHPASKTATKFISELKISHSHRFVRLYILEYTR